MSAEEDAYGIALRIIAKTEQDGESQIGFGTRAFCAMNKIPPNLADLTSLTLVNLNRTQTTDLSPLSTLTQLQELRLRDTKVTNLSPLLTLTGLQSLDLRSTQVVDLRPIRNCRFQGVKGCLLASISLTPRQQSWMPN